MSASGAAAGLLLVVAGLWLLLQTLVAGLANRLVNLGGSSSSSSSSAASTAKNAAGAAAAGVKSALGTLGGIVGNVISGTNPTQAAANADAASGVDSASPVAANGQPTPYGQAQGVQTS